MMLTADRLFDFKNDGYPDLTELAFRLRITGETDRRAAGFSGNFGFSDFTDNDDIDVFADAELEFMDPSKRRYVLEEAGLDPDEFDF